MNVSSREVTEIRGKSKAVMKGGSGFTRVNRLRELKVASGKMDYRDVSEAMEGLELSERLSSQ